MKLMKKISSKKGFSLSELLVALLVVSIMTIALTAGVSASMRVYNESIRHAEERTLLSTLAEAVMSELRNARDPKIESGVVTFTSLNYGPGASFSVGADGKMKIAEKDLIGDGSYIKGKIKLDAGTANTFVSYDETSGIFKVKLTCAGSGESREFSIRPMAES
ncbi:MAG: type II secretion system protein [Eubacteriales bacterium]|nr:type II secretion system protein [Eubacteriales bacterium]